MLRARKVHEKEERRNEILAAGRELWSERKSHAAFNMSEVAERAGLAKGTLYIYFDTKEALLLALLSEELSEWLGEMDEALDQGGTWSELRVSTLLSESLGRRPTLTQLLALMSSILEGNVPEQEVLSFKTFLLDRVAVTAARLERRLPFLQAGEGGRLLVMCHALVTGLFPMANPPTAVDRVLRKPEMAVFRVDFEKDLGATLHAMLRGMRESVASRSRDDPKGGGEGRG